jgi:hypothetical protein
MQDIHDDGKHIGGTALVFAESSHEGCDGKADEAESVAPPSNSIPSGFNPKFFKRRTLRINNYEIL